MQHQRRKKPLRGTGKSGFSAGDPIFPCRVVKSRSSALKSLNFLLLIAIIFKNKKFMLLIAKKIAFF